MEKTNVNKIDEKVQEAMESLQVPFNPDHWTQMEQRLSLLDADEKAFDESVQRRLKGAEMPFNDAHWDLMNQKLSDLDNEEAGFDNSIRRMFNKSETPYKPANWDLMSDKLDQEFSWKAKVVRYKVVEVALMILFLFTVINMLDTEGVDVNGLEHNKLEIKNAPKSFENQGADWRNNKSAQPQTIPSEDNRKKVQSNNPPLVLNDIKTGSQKSLNSSLNTEGGILKTQTQNAIASIDATNIDFNNNTEQGVNESLNLNKKQDALEVLPTIKTLVIAFNETKADLNLNDKKVIAQEAIAVAEPLEILRTKSLSISSLYDEPELPKSNKKNRWWRLGVFGTANTDMADISFKYKGTEGKGSDWSINRGAGITLGYKKGKLELSTGLAYSQKHYQTQLPTEVIRGSVITGTAERAILPKSVDLEMVQVPLSISYPIKEMGRWSIYGSVGASANMAIGIDVQYYETPSSIQPIFDLRNVNATDLPKYGEPFKVGLEKNYNNFYFSTHLSAGVDYKITPKVSAYIQPNFEKHFGNTGIGTRNDKINTLSLHAGLKVNINKSKF